MHLTVLWQSCLVLCLNHCHYSQWPSSKSYCGMKMGPNFPIALGALICEVNWLHAGWISYLPPGSSFGRQRWTTNHTKNHSCIPGRRAVSAWFQHAKGCTRVLLSSYPAKKMKKKNFPVPKPKGIHLTTSFFPIQGMAPPPVQLKVPAMSPRHCIAAMGKPKRKAEKQVKGGRFSAWQKGRKLWPWTHGPWLLNFPLLLFIYISPISMISMISISINRYSTLVTVIIDTPQSYQSYPPRSATTMLFSVSSASSPVLTSEGLTHRTSKTQTVLTWPDTTSQQEPQKGRI